MHGARAVLQFLDLAFMQSLFDDANDTTGAQNAGKAQENFIFNSMKTLKKKKRWHSCTLNQLEWPSVDGFLWDINGITVYSGNFILINFFDTKLPFLQLRT